jgi:hypothetical protein
LLFAICPFAILFGLSSSLTMALRLGAAVAVKMPGIASSLYEQTLCARIAAQRPLPAVSYLLLDTRTGQLLGERWDSPSGRIPVGSLVKPFAALAYAESHRFSYPVFLCRGNADGCWWPRGHGRIGMKNAIEGSCNAYFRQLVREVSLEHLQFVIRSLGIDGEPDPFSEQALVGLGAGWPVTPVSIARAYCALAARSEEPGVKELIQGMALSARTGTGQAVSSAVPRTAFLVKTGTGPCVHSAPEAETRVGEEVWARLLDPNLGIEVHLSHGSGDGYAVVLWPADSPRYALLLAVHGMPGAKAAAVCGEILRAAGVE